QGVVSVPAGACSKSGPNGIVVIQPQNQLWAGDGDSSAKVVDLSKGTIINSIKTNGNCRSDELAYDAADGIIVIVNDADAPPFFTFISTAPQPILGQLQFPDAPGNGVEQPAWSPTTGLFYVAAPKTTANAGGEIAVLDPRARSFVGHLPLTNCAPHGLALVPHPFATAGCRTTAHSFVINILT